MNCGTLLDRLTRELALRRYHEGLLRWLRATGHVTSGLESLRFLRPSKLDEPIAELIVTTPGLVRRSAARFLRRKPFATKNDGTPFVKILIDAGDHSRASRLDSGAKALALKSR